MESIRTRIHPLMAAAAVSVVVVSLAGTAAITGLLPSSHGATAPQQSEQLPPGTTAVAVTPAPAAAQAPVATAYAQPAEREEVRHTTPHTHAVHHHYTEVARNDEPSYQQRPAPQPRQPNYVGIGAGALIGGILGHQVGGGNGKKLATVAGAIGGGIIGNEIGNR